MEVLLSYDEVNGADIKICGIRMQLFYYTTIMDL